MKRIMIIFSVIIIFEACAYYDVVDYKDSDGNIEYRTYLNDDLYVEFKYLFCDKSNYDEENPKYYLVSRCSVWSENKIELINIDIVIRTENNEIFKFDVFLVQNGNSEIKYNSFKDFLKEKQIRFGWNNYMLYDYEYVKNEVIILEYSIEIKENGKLYKLKREKKLHRNMRRVRTYPWFGT